jgi:hypothetical protein
VAKCRTVEDHLRGQVLLDAGLAIEEAFLVAVKCLVDVVARSTRANATLEVVAA